MKKSGLTDVLSAAAGAAASTVLQHVAARIPAELESVLRELRLADDSNRERLRECERRIDLLLQRVATLELDRARHVLSGGST